MKKSILTPSARLREWADCEIGVIIHLDLEVFEPSYDVLGMWGYHPDLSVFDPDGLDTDQWLEAAVAAGAKYAVLVAKHCSGFCLWPTKQHPYNVSSTPWQDGKGDVVRDFFRSCKKYGVKPGLYYSASHNAYWNVDNPGLVRGGTEAQQRAYNEMVLAQLTELWTEYGDVFEIWFDGGCLPVEQGGPDIAALLKQLQPDAAVFQGPPGIRSGLRWVGNERAEAPEDCWATVNFSREAFDGCTEADNRGGDPFGDTWRPAESDMPNRHPKAFMAGWFWKAGEESYIYPAEELFQRYLKSVGRNTNLLLGMNIDCHGRFPEADAREFSRFGQMVTEHFGTPKEVYSGDHSAWEYTLETQDGTAARYLVVQEDIAQGERILRYRLSTGYEACCIGHKKIIPLPEGTNRVTFTIVEAKDTPMLRSIALY